MHDLVIRNGLVVDGTGTAPVEGISIAIDGDRITAVGPDVGPGRKEIDATGLVVTNATRHNQRVWRGDLADLGAEPVPSPSVLVIGAVARDRQVGRWLETISLNA
ncbi:MAG: hypothetical protein O3C27_05410 [Actinomycetota bacterium]|nr:hypothetical protein [Actinomycetota bacterium]